MSDHLKLPESYRAQSKLPGVVVVLRAEWTQSSLVSDSRCVWKIRPIAHTRQEIGLVTRRMRITLDEVGVPLADASRDLAWLEERLRVHLEGDASGVCSRAVGKSSCAFDGAN